MFIISTTYPDLMGTVYPDSIDTYEKLSDITVETLQYALQYSVLYNQGKLEEAYALLETHPELKRCVINADKINKLIDAIKALEMYGRKTDTNISNITNTVSTLNVKIENIEQTGSSITKESIGLGNVDNTADANKYVYHAVHADNSDTIDGFHITASTAELTAGSSPLTTNLIYLCYE